MSSTTTRDTCSSTKTAEEEEEEDVIAGWLLLEECLSECGEQEEGSEQGAVRFISDPYSSLLVFQSSSSYITINGNEETCGSSFSDCGTVSFMATLHSTTPNVAAPNPPTFLGLLHQNHPLPTAFTQPNTNPVGFSPFSLF